MIACCTGVSVARSSSGSPVVLAADLMLCTGCTDNGVTEVWFQSRRAYGLYVLCQDGKLDMSCMTQKHALVMIVVKLCETGLPVVCLSP